MPFCPGCRLEYREGFVHCPDCDLDLVAELPPAPPPEAPEPDYAQEWVPVAQLTSQVYAAMAEDVLKQRGIPVTLLSSTGHFGQLGSMGVSTFQAVEGAYIILVPPAHVAAADAEGEALLGDLWRKSRLYRRDE